MGGGGGVAAWQHNVAMKFSEERKRVPLLAARLAGAMRNRPNMWKPPSRTERTDPPHTRTTGEIVARTRRLRLTEADHSSR